MITVRALLSQYRVVKRSSVIWCLRRNGCGGIDAVCRDDRRCRESYSTTCRQPSKTNGCSALMGVGCAVLGFSFVTESATSWLPSGERPKSRSFIDQLRDVSFNERYFDAINSADKPRGD